MKVVNRVLSPADFTHEIEAILQEGRGVRFRVQGYSMRVFLEHERDEVLLIACQPKDVKQGDVVLAKITHTCTVLHRIISIKGQQLTLQGDGNVGKVEHCSREAVIGRVVGFYRKGASSICACDSLKWKIYSRLWLSLSPLRRYLLAAYRHLWIPLFGPL